MKKPTFIAISDDRGEIAARLSADLGARNIRASRFPTRIEMHEKKPSLRFIAGIIGGGRRFFRSIVARLI
jgi:hypothetical protein